MSDQNQIPAARRPRRKRKNYSLLILAAVIFLFGVAAGTLYYVLRPVTLRIAVGPPGSEDQKLIQALAQTFASDRNPVRLAPITTEGATESIALLAAGMAAQAAAFLERANWLTALDNVVWDSGWLLSDTSIAGRALHTLIGYTDQPTAMQLTVYLAILLTTFVLMRFVGAPVKTVQPARS